ncbi:DUF1275 domain protein [Xylariomycetidae sp. FL0641]|nr:DUF1275 domain protein [Xylariomycetidae sp. FL0641]
MTVIQDEEKQQASSTTTGPRLTKHFSEVVESNFGAYPLLACCFTTGLTDGTLFNAFSTFVSMQTGNTVFIALGTAGRDTIPYSWAFSLASLGCFVFGCAFFSRLNKMMGGGRLRRSLVVAFLLQTIFVAISAGIIDGNVVDDHYPEDHGEEHTQWTIFIPVALLSFQAASQIVTSRALAVGEVPTVVITSLLCDLVSDDKLFAPLLQNVKRNRRVVGFVLTLLGAIAAAHISKSTSAVQPALWFACAIKAVITLVFLLPARFFKIPGFSGNIGL